MLLAWFLITVHVLAVSAVPDYPGSQVTEQKDGKEVFITYFSKEERIEMTFYVKDYGVLRPKVVYNCAIVRSLCANAIEYLGAGVSSKSFHFDMDSRRATTRRDSVCYDGWIGTEDNPRCPQPNQPRWDFYDPKEGRWAKDQEVVMWTDKDGTPDLRDLAFKKPASVKQEDGSVRIQDKLYKHKMQLTCDEFPAATWIQGGKERGIGGKSATTQCTPQSGCNGKRPKGKSKVSEQDWQSSAFRQVRSWLQKMSASRNNSGREDIETIGVKDAVAYRLWYQQHYFIYNIEFEMKTISDPNDEAYGTAVWLEANGHKRYCFGPSVKAACSIDRQENDPEPVNEDMPGESAWQSTVWPDSPKPTSVVKLPAAGTPK